MNRPMQAPVTGVCLALIGFFSFEDLPELLLACDPLARSKMEAMDEWSILETHLVLFMMRQCVS